jgi:hypothetical protein
MKRAEAKVLNEVLDFALHRALEEISTNTNAQGKYDPAHWEPSHLGWLQKLHAFEPGHGVSADIRRLSLKALNAYVTVEPIEGLGYEASCAICGCTEDQACPGGCCWVEDPQGLMRDICSACERKARKQ